MDVTYAGLFSKLSKGNAAIIEMAGGYTCFYCGSTHNTVAEIVGGDTVVCESCGIDACIPHFTPEVLAMAKAIQF